VGQRQPDVQRHRAGLDAEAEQQQQHDDVTRLRAGHHARGVRDEQTALLHHQEQAGEDEHLADHGQDDVDPSRSPGRGGPLVHDEAVCREAHHGEDR
jgi:hypothetical protein